MLRFRLILYYTLKHVKNAIIICSKSAEITLNYGEGVAFFAEIY